MPGEFRHSEPLIASRAASKTITLGNPPSPPIARDNKLDFIGLSGQAGIPSNLRGKILHCPLIRFLP
jgi:hypothetical protein